MRNRNWFWGFFFLAAAVFVIASQVGSFGQFGLFTILATVFLVAILVQSIVALNYFGILLPLAFLYMTYEKPLGFMHISPWMLIISALLASIGLSVLFGRHNRRFKKFENFHHNIEHATTENTDDNNPYVKVNFGAANRYLHSDCLTSGQFIVSFGALEVFFDQAQLSPAGAEIFIDCNFGGMTLYIPKHWNVKDNLHMSLGGVDNNIRFAKPDENSPCLTLSGNVKIGGVEIKYI